MFPPERPCGERCGGLGAQSPHQTGQVFPPEAETNSPGTFSGAEMQINGAAFFKQSFELKIKGDLIPGSRCRGKRVERNSLQRHLGDNIWKQFDRARER